MRYNLQAKLFDHLRRDRIGTTFTIHNHFPILLFYLIVCVEDSSSPVILLLRLWECTSDDIYIIWRCKLNIVTFSIITFLVIIGIVFTYVWVICNFLVMRLGACVGTPLTKVIFSLLEQLVVMWPLPWINFSGGTKLGKVCPGGLLRSSLHFPLKSFFQEDWVLDLWNREEEEVLVTLDFESKLLVL